MIAFRAKGRTATRMVIAFLAIISASLLVSCERESKASPGTSSAERKILYYQSPMHPWVKSDKPG